MQVDGVELKVDGVELTEDPRGIGGWLIFPLLNLIVSPIVMVVSFFVDVLPLFEAGLWQIATTPSHPAYDPIWAPLIVFEMSANVILLILVLVVLVKFLGKRRSTPRLMIIWLLAATFVQIADAVLTRQIPAVAASAEISDYRDLIRTVIFSVVWIPYFLVSRRVKNTFVE